MMSHILGVSCYVDWVYLEFSDTETFFSNFPSRRSSFKDVSLAVIPLLTSKVCIVNVKTEDCQYAIGG